MKALRLFLPLAILARSSSMGAAIVLTLASLDRTGGIASGTFVLTALTLPHVIAAPMVGALADRVRSPRTLYGGAILLFGAAVCTAAVLVGRVPLAWPMAVAAIAGCCGPLITGGLSSLLDHLVAERYQLQARGMDAATYGLAELGAPPLYAFLTVAAGADLSAALMCTATTCAAALVFTLPLERRLQTARTFWPWPAIAYIAKNGRLRAVTVASGVAFIGTGALAAAAVLLSTELGEAAGGGLLMSCVAAGALLGSLVWSRWPVRRLRIEHVALVGFAGCGAALLGAGWSGEFIPAAVLFAIAGFFDGPALIAVLQVRSEEATPAVRTQIFTIGAGLKVSFGAAGAAILGWTAELGAAGVLTWIGLVHIVAAIGLRQPYKVKNEAGA